MKLTKDIRKEFIKYFKDLGHEEVNSSSLIPKDDPTLMFVNSGMVQFKNIFTGIEEKKYKKAVTAQKCVRAGGKHNDLDNVGYTKRHHTFFEMLGNFSFGDYFKEESIKYAWDLLTKNFHIDKNKLYFTYYHTDLETKEIWKKVTGLNENRIIPIKTNDNFWSMGDTGPCGPCTEIFYDHGDHIQGGLPGTKYQDGDRYVEIWNMVFMQYQRIANKELIELPKKSIDTGMGIERIAATLQGVSDNYETDILKNLILGLEEIIKVKINEDNISSFKVIIDHARSVFFLISAGITPSSEGRGYVLRRIMRRAIRHIEMLGCTDIIFYKLCSLISRYMGDYYDELTRYQEFASSIMYQEEENFKETLFKGIKLLNKESKNLKKGDTLPGSTLFKLYDTYGFPSDLTEEMLRSRGIKIDNPSFEKFMKEQKDRSKNSNKSSQDQSSKNIWFDILAKWGKTNFKGYEENSNKGLIREIIYKNELVKQLSKIGEKFYLVTDLTCFYAESGGQVGDTGYMKNSSFLCKVIDTKYYANDLIVHECLLEKGVISSNDDILMEVDFKRREKIKKNHTATHILHEVLKNILGDHICQKGSLVDEDKLRFDFNSKSLNEDLIKKIEDKVNNIIFENYEVNIEVVSKQDAIKQGATALFDDKYSDYVRVVTLGSDKNDKFRSKELCGGMHVKSTQEIGLFVIKSESSIGSGVRRIEAITSKEALNYHLNNKDIIDNLSIKLSVSKEEIIEKIELIVQDNKSLKKEIEDMKIRDLIPDEKKFNENNKIINGLNFYIDCISGFDHKIVRISMMQISKKYTSSVIIFILKVNDNITILISSGKDINNNIRADDLVRHISKELLGKNAGGGSKEIAQIGGLKNIDINKLTQILRDYKYN